jgi:hypothetical protein
MGAYNTTTSYFCGQVCKYRDECPCKDGCPVFQFAEYLAKQLIEKK